MTNFLMYSPAATLLLGGFIIFIALGIRTALQQDPGPLAARMTLWISGIYMVVLVWAFGSYVVDAVELGTIDVPIPVIAYFPIDSLDPQSASDGQIFASGGEGLLSVRLEGLPTPFLAIRMISTALGTIIILTLALSIFALARKRLSGAPLLATAGTIAWRGTVVIVVAASTKAAIAWISLGWFVGRFNESLGQYMSKNENYVFDIQPLEDFPWHQIELWPSLVALLFCVLALILTANARLEKETAGLV